MDAMKINRRKSKVFGCFKPVEYSGDEPPCELKTPPPVSGDESDRSGRSRKRSSRRRLYGAVKAVFCIKMPLAKTVQTENPNKVLQRSISNLSSNGQKLVKSMKKSFSFSDPTLISRTTSNNSSSLLSSSSSSSLTASSSTLSLSLRSSGSFNSMSEASAPSSRSVSSRPINGQKSIKRDMASVEMCVLLVCLVSLVFWGKVFAIVASTLTWLFFGPVGGGGGAASRRRFKGFESPENGLFESEEYKKRVVMEGLLERNRPIIRKLSFSA